MSASTGGPVALDLAGPPVDGADARSQPEGFWRLPTDVAAAAQAVAWAQQQTAQRMVVLGIGGSSLGAKAVIAATGARERVVDFADNADPASFGRLLASVDWRATMFAIVTKSGGTAETWAQTLVVTERLRQAGLPLTRHMIAVTDPASGELRRLASELGLQTFAVPPDVGGRFSVLSPVGLVPAAFAGVDTTALLAGAAAAEVSLAARLAAWLFAEDRHHGRAMHVMMTYGDDWYDVAYWWRQLWAESLGKRNRAGQAVGPTPLVARGSTDQHSLLQLFSDGPDDKAYILLAPSERPALLLPDAGFGAGPAWQDLIGHSMGALLDAAMVGTRDALRAVGRPVATLRIRPDAFGVGALLQTWMAATAYAGDLYDVNAFDQPGVEEAKRRARKALRDGCA